MDWKNASEREILDTCAEFMQTFCYLSINQFVLVLQIIMHLIVALQTNHIPKIIISLYYSIYNSELN